MDHDRGDWRETRLTNNWQQATEALPILIVERFRHGHRRVDRCGPNRPQGRLRELPDGFDRASKGVGGHRRRHLSRTAERRRGICPL